MALSESSDCDKWSWCFSEKGLFSVKSCYQMLHKVKFGYDINNEADFKFWKTLWYLSIPNKDKHFCWRLCRDIIPVLDNLNKKGLDIPNCCFFCNNNAETARHVFLNCNKVNTVWSSAPFGRVLTSHQLPNYEHINVLNSNH